MSLPLGVAEAIARARAVAAGAAAPPPPPPEPSRPPRVVMDESGRVVDERGNVVEMRRAPRAAPDPAPPKVAPRETHNPYFDPRLAPAERRRGRRAPPLEFVPAGTHARRAQRFRARQLAEEMKEEMRLEAPVADDPLLAAARRREEVPAEEEWWDAGVGEEQVTADVVHPVPDRAVIERAAAATVPVYLTRQERRKIRRQRRLAEHQEKTDLIRFGLVPAPEPRMTLKNMMAVLSNDATLEPTELERKVRAQMASRKRAHEAHNDKHRLTDEQRREKRRRKLAEDTSREVRQALFRVGNLRDPRARFRVDVTTQQHGLTGVSLIHPACHFAFVEGGPRGVRAFERMVLRRIRWGAIGEGGGMDVDAQQEAGDDESESESESDSDGGGPESKLATKVWEGVSNRRLFPTFRFHTAATDEEARRIMQQRSAAHLWDAARHFRPPEAGV